MTADSTIEDTDVSQSPELDEPPKGNTRSSVAFARSAKALFISILDPAKPSYVETTELFTGKDSLNFIAFAGELNFNY